MTAFSARRLGQAGRRGLAVPDRPLKNLIILSNGKNVSPEEIEADWPEFQALPKSSFTP
jgi:hypothetical protein